MISILRWGYMIWKSSLWNRVTEQELRGVQIRLNRHMPHKERSAFVRDRARYKEKTCCCIRILDDRRASHSSSLCIPKAPVYRWPELTYKWRMPAETSCWSIFPIMGNLLCHFLYKRAAFLPRPPIKRPLTTQQPNNPIILLAVLLWGPPKTTWEDNSKGLCPKPP